MKHTIGHSLEVIGFAALGGGFTAATFAVTAGAPEDLTSGHWWITIGVAFAAGAWKAGKIAAAHELDPDPDPDPDPS